MRGSGWMFAVVTIWCGIAILGDSLIKNGRWVSGLFLYALCVAPAVLVLAKEELGWVTVAWAAMSVLVGLSVSVGVFREPLTPRRLIAGLLAVAAAYFAR